MATKGERTRSRLVEVAGQLFGTHGVDAVTVEQICLTAGVAKGTFYGHFRRREDVLLAAIGAFLEPLERQVNIWIAAGWPIDRIMERLVDYLALLALADRQIVARALAEAITRPADFRAVSGRDLASMLEPLFAAAQEHRQVRDDVPARTLARICGSLLVATLLRWAQDEAAEALADELRTSLRILLEGFRLDAGAT